MKDNGIKAEKSELEKYVILNKKLVYLGDKTIQKNITTICLGM